jgi:trimethylamine--corrinoid protein Co-methyltransferase
MGISGVDQASSLDMLVMQDEVIRFVESVLREVDFSDDALALDEVLSADRDRSFAGREHTVRHFRRELWFPRLLDRSYYDEWLDSGATDMEERCRRRKAHILETHRPEPPPDGMARSLDRIVSAARRELVGTQRRTG